MDPFNGWEWGAVAEEQVVHLTVQGRGPRVAAAAFLRFNLQLQLCQSCGNGTVKTPNLLISCCSPPKSEGEFLEILELLQ